MSKSTRQEIQGPELKIAYADPPYVNQAKKHYRNDPKCAEIDQVALLNQLENEYDGWALSMSATMESFKTIIPGAPSGARMAAWVKPFCSFKKGVNPAYTWEPVLFKPARKKLGETVRDHLACNIALQKGLVGAKPRAFCFWLFDLLGMQQNDQFIDLFPGTGIVTLCWEEWRQIYKTESLFRE